MRLFSIFLSALVFCIPSLEALQDNIRDPYTRIEFPFTADFSTPDRSYELEATGVATRAKYVVKIYSVAHYMENPVPGNLDAVLDQVFSDEKAKQLSTVWLHKIEAKRIRSGFMESFHEVLTPEQWQEAHPLIKEFLGYFDEDAKPNDLYVFRWLPGGEIEFYVNGKLKGRVVDICFAQALWSIWFSPNSVTDRNRLLKLIVTN